MATESSPQAVDKPVLTEVGAFRQTVLITGATGGLGTAFAELFDHHNWHLVLTGRNIDSLKKLASKLKDNATLIEIDLGVPGAVPQLMAELAKRDETIDALVNNAGFSNFGLFHEIPVEKSNEMLVVNIRTLTELTRNLLPGMVERKRGYVLNVASTAAFMPGPYMATYYASKAYVLSFSEALAEELKGTGVNVTCLCPGPTKTGFQNAAKMENSKLMTGNFMAPEPVVRAGYQALMSGKTVVIPGLMNQIQALMPKLMPRKLIPGMVK
ncbi:MAG: short-chain dehydrogenase, partial [Armatimonadetes bacterium Cent15-Ar3]